MAAVSIPTELNVLRTTLLRARLKLASWLEPDGISAERCLSELLELFFHPALDQSVYPDTMSHKGPLGVMRRAVAHSRRVLIEHFGEQGTTDGETCLAKLTAVLNWERLLDAADFSDMFDAEKVIGRMKRPAEVIRFPTFH
jgi:hypothetical protein